MGKLFKTTHEVYAGYYTCLNHIFELAHNPDELNIAMVDVNTNGCEQRA